MRNNIDKPKIISLFSGAGGMDLGFIKAGFEVVWANDFNKDAVETYKNNIGNHITHKDICSIESKDIPDDADVVIGGFPCQGFSIANKNRNITDKRNFLYKEMLRIIKEKNPKVVVAENVKGLLSLEKGKVFEMIKNDFTQLGYTVVTKLLNAAEYGVAQKRERVIIVGYKTKKNFIFPTITNSNDPKKKLPKLKTVADAIGWLVDYDCNNEIKINEDKTIYQHIANHNVADKFWGRVHEINQAEICDYLNKYRKVNKLSSKKIDDLFGYKHTAGHWFRKDNGSGSIPKPNDWWKLKKLLNFDDFYDKQVTEFVEKPVLFQQSLRITNWNTPSDTITATCPEIHINKKRRLSVRECAILQTFPDDFIFCGKTIGSMYKQIGNAVPVLLSTHIAKQVKKILI